MDFAGRDDYATYTSKFTGKLKDKKGEQIEGTWQNAYTPKSGAVYNYSGTWNAKKR